MDKTTLQHEMSILRDELQHLKRCQLHYFSLSITVTGVILGLVQKNSTPTDITLVYLAPLIVIIPCWWIFFDKAKSITRIVGYYRILENGISHPNEYKFIGWENSLELFREWQIKGKLLVHTDNTKNKALKLMTLDTPHRYWLINWYTYCTLSILCIILYSTQNTTTNSYLIAGSSIMVFITILVTATILVNLIYKGSSYKANQENWIRILLAVHDVRIHKKFVKGKKYEARQIVSGKNEHRQRIKFMNRTEHDPVVYSSKKREDMDKWIDETLDQLILEYIANPSVFENETEY